MKQLWSQDSGLTDVTAAFQGFSQPLSELTDDIHRRGWTVNKISVKDGEYVAEGKNPHGESLEAKGRTDATAAANLLVKIMRREHMRASAARSRLGAWDHQPIEQQLSAIAQAYAGAPVYDPKAASAWMELAQDCGRRVLTIRTQVVIEYTHDPVPYETADEMREDVTKKRHILVSRAYPHHPIWSEQQMLDYRVVIDVLGHCVGGADWGWHGTCLAFAALAPMFAESAQKALFTELLGQSAFGTFYRQWGPQKIAFLDELVAKAQEQGNQPGHTGVHPSQSIVPASIPSVFGAVTTPLDPNADWQSGITPLQDAAYLWQRRDGTEPLDMYNATNNLRQLDPGLSRLHPEMAKQSVVNALRASLLGSRTNPRGHAIHYQDLMHIPANVDDPMAYWDALEQQREQWNQLQGYAPESHKQHWPEEQQFKQWVKATNPQLDDGEVQRTAKRELHHMLVEEEERLLAQDQGEQLPAEQIEHEAYEALRRRLKALTKPTVDQRVDFGNDHLWHESASQYPDWYVNYDPIPDVWYEPEKYPMHKGTIDESGKVRVWPVNVGGFPHHSEMAIPPYQEDDTADFVIDNGVVYSIEDPTPYPAEYRQQVFNAIRPQITFRQPRTSTHHADMYPPYLASRLRPIAQVSRHADELAQAAQEDLLSHKGRGHHFRATALKFGIPQLGPRQVSHAWLHLAPQTSQLGIVDPHISEVLGHDYRNDMSNRDYFKHERELAAARDASGYNHVPLGAFSSALWDLKAGGPGWHPDRSPFKSQSPTPHRSIDWNAQVPSLPAWSDPYFWSSTQQARDQVAKDFDRTVAVEHPRDEIPFQKTAASACPKCGERQLNMIYDQTKNWVPRFQCANCGFEHLIAGESREIGTPYTDDERNQMWTDVVKSPNRDPLYLDPDNWSQFGPRRQGRTAGAEARSPWVTHPVTGERLTGAPGTSLMQHLKNSFGHPSVQEVWDQDYEVGKGSPGTISRVAGLDPSDPAPIGTIARVASVDDEWRSRVLGPNAQRIVFNPRANRWHKGIIDGSGQVHVWPYPQPPADAGHDAWRDNEEETSHANVATSRGVSSDQRFVLEGRKLWPDDEDEWQSEHTALVQQALPGVTPGTIAKVAMPRIKQWSTMYHVVSPEWREKTERMGIAAPAYLWADPDLAREYAEARMPRGYSMYEVTPRAPLVPDEEFGDFNNGTMAWISNTPVAADQMRHLYDAGDGEEDDEEEDYGTIAKVAGVEYDPNHDIHKGTIGPDGLHVWPARFNGQDYAPTHEDMGHAGKDFVISDGQVLYDRPEDGSPFDSDLTPDERVAINQATGARFRSPGTIARVAAEDYIEGHEGDWGGPGENSQDQGQAGDVPNRPESSTKAAATYYRGSGADRPSLQTGFPEWDRQFFMADRPDYAALYGPNVERIELAPDTRILYENAPETRPIFEAARQKALQQGGHYALHALNTARNQGYHAVHYRDQSAFGTVLLDPSQIASCTPHRGT